MSTFSVGDTSPEPEIKVGQRWRVKDSAGLSSLVVDAVTADLVKVTLTSVIFTVRTVDQLLNEWELVE